MFDGTIDESASGFGEGDDQQLETLADIAETVVWHLTDHSE